MKKLKLSGSQLKLIALILMTLDHIGIYLFPEMQIFRALGRPAFPIFAFMIAEGCRHTHDRRKYFLSVAGLAVLCQIIFRITDRTMHLSVLVTFSLSIGLIFLLDGARATGSKSIWAAFGVFFAAVVTAAQLLPAFAPQWTMDYGLLGVMLPVALYLTEDRKAKLGVTAVFLLGLSVEYGPIQLFSLLSLPLLLLYSGKRGTAGLKYFFYLYYPLHLVLLQMVARCL